MKRWRTGPLEFALGIALGSGLIFFLGIQFGRWLEHREPFRCAAVQGEQVISTTAEVCTYAVSYGRATRKRRAM